MTDTSQVANALVAHCRNGTTQQGVDELYAQNAQSVEAWAMPGGDQTVWDGTEAIKGKQQWWEDNFEVHSVNIDGPYVNGDAFSVIFEIDATNKGTGERSAMKEIGNYEVSGGKIQREAFFFPPMPG